MSSTENSVKCKVFVRSDKSLRDSTNRNWLFGLLLPLRQASPCHVVDPLLSAQGINNDIKLTRIHIDCFASISSNSFVFFSFLTIHSSLQQVLDSIYTRAHKRVRKLMFDFFFFFKKETLHFFFFTSENTVFD